MVYPFERSGTVLVEIVIRNSYLTLNSHGLQVSQRFLI